MAGYFYPPPPARIGGSQPFAPRLGIVQSGPTPEAPPLRGPVVLATLAVIAAAWTPPYVRAQTSAQIAPLIPAVVASGPPPVSRQNQAIIASAWNRDPVTVIYVSQIASQTTVTADQPPILSQINFETVLQSWQPKPQPFQYRPFTASQPIVNDPPRSSSVNAQTILRAWVPPAVASQGYAEIAPLLPVAAVADQPPTQSLVNQRTIVTAWQPAWIAAQGYSEIAPLLPVAAPADQPPVLTRVNTQLVLSAWIPPWVPPQGFSRLAPFIPAAAVPDQPPVPSWVNQRTVLSAWVPPWMPPQGFVRIAPALPRVDAPPRRTHVNAQVIARRWEPAWGGPPRPLAFVSIATPDAFSFVDQTNVALSTLITSAAITVSGITAAATISVSGGQYSINGAAFTSSPGSVVNGDSVRAQNTSSASNSTATNTIVTIGGVSDTFTSTTVGAVSEIVPYLIGYTQAPAEAVIRALRCIPVVIGSGGSVSAQDPAAFTVVSRGVTITITMGGELNTSQPKRGQQPYNRNIH